MKRYENIIRCFIAGLATSFLSMTTTNSFSQTSEQAIPAASAAKDSAVLSWLESLYEENVTVEGDSVKMGKETERLLTDEAYRQAMYPATYTWDVAVYFISKQDIKRACWFLMNLYLINDKNKEVVIKSLVTYDKLFKMDKILTNAFYTYVLTDPEIGTLADGEFKVTAPHIIEKKLNALKEILFYLDKYRATEGKAQISAGENK